MARTPIVFDQQVLLDGLRRLQSEVTTTVDPGLSAIYVNTRQVDGTTEWSLSSIGRLALDGLEREFAWIESANQRNAAQDALDELKEQAAAFKEIADAQERLAKCKLKYSQASQAIRDFAMALKLPGYTPVAGSGEAMGRYREWKMRLLRAAYDSDNPLPKPPKPPRQPR